MNELKHLIQERMVRELGPEKTADLTRNEVADRVEILLDDFRRAGADITEQRGDEITAEIIQDMIGFGPLHALMHDPSVTEIMVNAPDVVFIERDGKKQRADVRFRDMEHLRFTVHRLLAMWPGKRLDESSPYVDVTLDDGARVNMVIPPVAYPSPNITIRKYSRWFDGTGDFVANGTLDGRMEQFMSACVRAQMSMLFSGATGSGKTTLLEVFGYCIPDNERLVVIEDTMELQVRQPNVVRLLTRDKNIEGRGEVTIGQLFVNSLRMRADRILLGEIRGAEALDYLQAVNSGHTGSFAVVHASSPHEAVLRLENLVPTAGYPIPVNVTRSQISEGIQLIVQCTQFPDGRRVISKLTEVGDVGPDGQVMLHDIFVFRATGRDAQGTTLGSFAATGRVPAFHETMRVRGEGMHEGFFRAD